MSNHRVDKKYLEFVRTLPCSHCRTEPAEPHHAIGVGAGIMGGKASDIHTCPLCRECHREVHSMPKIYPQFKWVMETQNKAIDAGVL